MVRSRVEKHTTTPEVPPLIMAKPSILVAEIGRTCTSVVRSGNGIDKKRIVRYPTPKNYQTLIENLGEISSVLFNGKAPNAVGFTVPGSINGNGFVTRFSERPGFVGQPIIQDVAEATKAVIGNVVGEEDMRAAAIAEQTVRMQSDENLMEGIYRLDSHLDGARFDFYNIISDQPGHEFLRTGALCSCGNDGCLEAHVSKTGIQRKFGLGNSEMPPGDPRWNEVKTDLVNGFSNTLKRYEQLDMDVPVRLAFFGSVVLNNPSLLGSLRAGLADIHGPLAPEVAPAALGGDSVLYGAHLIAQDTLVISS